MRIVILGGAGAMSRAVVTDLLREPEGVSLVTIADIDVDASRRLVEEARSLTRGTPEVRAVALDVHDHESLVDVVRDHTVALDATHQSCGAAVAKGVIDAGVSGCALGSDFATAREALAYNDLARQNGVTFLVAAGTFPGGTNLLAAYLAGQMEAVEDVHMSMVIQRPISLTPSLVDLFLSYMVTPGLELREGSLVETSPFSGRESIRFPEPFGDQTVYNIISSEPVTIPDALPAVRNVCTKATYHADYTEMLRTCHDLGLTGTESVEVDGREVVPRDVLRALLSRRPVEEGRDVVRFTQRVSVRGTLNGGRCERTIVMPFLPFAGQTHDAETRATGEAAAVIVRMLARGVDKKGVMGPESCLDAAEFVREWARRPGVVIQQS